MTSIEELEAKVTLLEEQLVRLRGELRVAENDLDDVLESIAKVLDSAAFKSDVNNLLYTLQRLGELSSINLSKVNL